ncbi:hypothetical protein I3843_05G043300 [Carya illinoinensis]|nr:hypothetical protein I3843_05G043300 [Carya illinoinensis]
MCIHGSRKQQDAIKDVHAKQMQKVFEALDMLGNTKWRINRRVLSIVECIWDRGGNIAGLINREEDMHPRAFERESKMLCRRLPDLKSKTVRAP